MPDPLWMDPRHEDRLLDQAATRRARYAAMLNQAEEHMAMRAAELTSTHPNASPGLVEAGVREGMDDEQFAQVAGLDGESASTGIGRFADFVTDAADMVYEQALKPAIRGTFAIADTLAQELIQRPVTAALSAEGNLLTNPQAFREAYNEYGDSPLVNVAQRDFAETDEMGTPVEGGSLGTGFFAAGQAGAESQQERTLTIDGNTATMGRALPTTRMVGALAGYDSTAYNAVAGVTQFAADVLLDPLALVTGGSASLARQATRAGVVAQGSRAQAALAGGVRGVRRQARQLDPSEASDILRQADEAGEEVAETGGRALSPSATSNGQPATLMREAGAISTRERNTVLVERATDFFGKREVLSKLAESDAYTIYQSFKKSAANQLDTDLIRKLGRATDESEVSEALLDAVQRGGVTEKGFYSGLRGLRKVTNNSKLAGTSARGRISVDDIGDASDKLDSFMRQAKVDRDTRADIFQRMIDLEDVPALERPEQFFNIVTDAMTRVSDNLAGDTEKIREAVQLQKGQIEDLREFGIDASGDPILTPLFKPKVDAGTGELVPSVGPQLTSELAKVGFELPDVTSIRRAAQRATRTESIYNSAGWKMGSDALRFATRDLFKPLAILRPAYVVRIGLEEQARLAAAGYDSLFNHPVRFLMANVLARTEGAASGRTARALAKLPGGGGVDEVKMNRDLGGDNWEDVADTLGVVNRRAYNVMGDPVQGRARQFTQMRKPAEPTTRYIGAWQHELAQLSAAREARWLASNGGDLDGFVDWARNSADGRSHVERIARVSDEAQDLLTSDDAVREWGRSINARLAAKAGGEVGEDGVVHALGDPEILDAIADGRLSGIRFSEQTKNANLHRTLRAKFDRAPAKLKVELEDAAGAAKQQGKLRKFVDGLFDNLTGKPTSYLARYPAFRQSYIKRAGELMPSLSDDAARRSFAQQIESAFTLTKAEKEGLTAAIARSMGKKGFYDDISELDEVVKLKAASEVKDLLFDVTKRSNIQDTYEVAAPFFDAWLEVTRTWGRLAKENPAFMLKAQQGYQSLRDSGVVYANDFGEEVFAYPGGGMLSKFFGNEDMSLRLEGRVQGANLVAQGVGPGFGPMVQWGVGALMPDTREWQEVREWMAPFGTGGIESAGDLANPSRLMESFIPAWAEKAIQAATDGSIDPVQWNSTVGDVMKVLAESGRYDHADPEEKQRLIDDAKKGGRFVLALRSLIQGVGLTGASATWELESEVDKSAIPEGWDPESDPDGRWHTLGTLGSELHRLAEFYDYDWQTATAKFVEMYGTEPHYITQSKTRSLTEAPVTTEGDYWMRDHADFAERHRAVAGYFVPPEQDPTLDYSVYRRQMETGDRQSLSAEQQLALANQTKARSLYYAAKARLEDAPPKVRDQALVQVREMIEQSFPGWRDDVLGVQASLDTGAKIERLAAAIEDPEADDSPVTEPLRIYMNARARVMSAAAARGYTTINNQGSADLRAALDQIGQRIADERPEFRGVWSQLLRREVDV